MHCWKVYTMDRKDYFFRRFFISAIVALFVFIISYVTFQTIADRNFNDDFFFVFIFIFILLYPAHKLFHFLPIMSYYKYMKWDIGRYFYILPVIDLKVGCPIPKARFAFALAFPFIIINAILIVPIFLYPQYGHYITILLAYHNGISVFDLLYLKTLFFSPKNALVEENEDGYDILVEDDTI